jgi:transposase
MLRQRYASSVTDSQWEVLAPFLPTPKQRGRRRRIELRTIIDAIFYLLRTGCQWRQLPKDFPTWNTVYWYFRSWERTGVWVRLQRELYRLTRIRSGRAECPSVVIMDGQSVKTTEVGGTRGFDAFKRVKGRKASHSGRHTGPADRQSRRGCRCFGSARRSPANQWAEGALSGDHHGNRRRGS